MSHCPLVVPTGGPGGGKMTLVAELTRDPVWSGPIAALPEPIFMMRGVGASPREKLFQRVIVHLQMGLEAGLARALEPKNPWLILCHRGSLDRLAYWLDRGWDEAEFFAFTGTTREAHYQRYAAVIHLVTAADGAEEAYKRWPDSHRPETPEQAIRLDQLLEGVWGDHPHYHRLDNLNCGWSEKCRRATSILEQYR